ncbi:MAG: dehydrogenase [Planctomycetota bacterium]|jgi:2,4-dienoyl-CoA reductase-like NADH-dependent reductase (Old Yellow Enzyme family)
MAGYPKVAQLRTVERFREHMEQLGVVVPIDDTLLSAAEHSPLAMPTRMGKLVIGNRWVIHPMEGWDANRDGTPSPLTLRRWQHFGESGAKWIWGGEAAAVRPDGRANPRQTMAIESNRQGLVQLRETLEKAHLEKFGTIDDLLIGLQLTHSGRFCKPNDTKRWEPRIMYHHPLLDPKFGIDPKDDSVVWTDAQLDELIEQYVKAAKLAWEAGYRFVDIKACHGYLLHESLSGFARPGRYGGDYEGRTRLLRSAIGAVKAACPELEIGVRISLFDTPPFMQGEEYGVPVSHDELLPYHLAFGCDPRNPLEACLDEPLRLMRDLKAEGVTAFNVTLGSPYYSPHLQRPAIFPPSDGYLPPEDPLFGVARHIDLTRRCREAVEGVTFVGSGYTYLQDFLPLVAQAVVARGWVDAVGLGRMVLSYPEMPADSLAGKQPARKLVCRTFSECTTAPRMGRISGCYPLDPFYKSGEAEKLSP